MCVSYLILDHEEVKTDVKCPNEAVLLSLE